MSPSETSPTPANNRSSVHADHHKSKWMWMAPLGLIGVGFGASAVARAATKWAQGQPYFLHGTFALVCLNASLSVFGDAVKHRALYDMKTGTGPNAMPPNHRTQDRHSGTL